MQRQNGNGVLAAFAPLDGKSGVAGGRQRRSLGGVRLVQRLVERILVDVAVERRRANVAVVGIAGEQTASLPSSRRVADRLSSVEWLSVVVRLGVDARVVAVEEALLLQAVAGQRVVRRTRRSAAQTSAMSLPAQLAEELPHIATASRRASRPRANRLPARNQLNAVRRAAVLEFAGARPNAAA